MNPLAIVSIPSLVGRLLGRRWIPRPGYAGCLSQYPRWWAGSSDLNKALYPILMQDVSIPSLVGRLLGLYPMGKADVWVAIWSQYPRWWAGSSDWERGDFECIKKAKSQYPRWWAGSSDVVCSLKRRKDGKVSIPSLVGRLLGRGAEGCNAAYLSSQYPRWWAGSSDSWGRLRTWWSGLRLNTLAGGQAPRTWHRKSAEPRPKEVSIPSLVGRLLGLSAVLPSGI